MTDTIYGVPVSLYNHLPADDQRAIRDGFNAAPPPPQVAPAPPPPPVEQAPTPPTPGNAPTPEYITYIDAQVAPATAAANALMAGGGSAEMAAAAEAAGADPATVNAILALEIPSLANVDVSSTAQTPTTTSTGELPQLSGEVITHDFQPDWDIAGYFPEIDGYEFAAVETLKGQAFIDYVRAGCAKRGLNAIVVLADSFHEGLGGGIGDNGTSYGPWQMHDPGALPKKYWGLGRNIARIQSWAWSTAGIDYALDIMQRVAGNASNPDDEMHHIVFDFEQPTKPQQQYITRLSTYYAFKAQGDKLWAMLAAYTKGATYPVVTAAAPPVTATKPAQTITTWRGLVATLRDDIPAAGVHMQNTAKRLGRAVT